MTLIELINADQKQIKTMLALPKNAGATMPVLVGTYEKENPMLFRFRNLEDG
jgi:hypothetical protein